MFSLIIIYTLFEVIADINFLLFQSSDNISWVIANVAVFFAQIAVLTVSAGAIWTLFGIFYARCIRNWISSRGRGIIWFIVVIWFTAVWWRHVIFVIIASRNCVSIVLYQDIN